MKKIGKILIIPLLMFSFSIALGQDAEKTAMPFDVFLSTDKQRFSDIEEINIKISVKNTSKETATFYIYEEKGDKPPYTTFQPRVYDMNGNEQENLTDYKLQNKYTVDVIASMNKREIALGGGEIFTYTVDLASIYKMEKGNFYRVRCYFVPDFGIRHVIHGKNEITFLVDGLREKDLQEKRLILNREMSPSETVLLTLEAEKNFEREKMLKYIKLDEYIKTESNFIRSYSAAGELEREEILEKFRWYLLRQRSDYLINYKIVDEGIEANDAYVDVLVERYNSRKNDSYKYRYVLKKTYETTENRWLITGLEASVHKGMVK